MPSSPWRHDHGWDGEYWCYYAVPTCEYIHCTHIICKVLKLKKERQVSTSRAELLFE